MGLLWWPTQPNLIETMSVEQLCDDFETRCRRQESPRIEDYLSRTPAASRTELLRELVSIEAYHRAQRGESVSPDEYAIRFPELQGELGELLRDALAVRHTSQPAAAAMALPLPKLIEQLTSYGLVPAAQLTSLLDPTSVGARPQDSAQLLRMLIEQQVLTAYQADELRAGRTSTLVLGNYLIVDKLGQGGMGMVLKARHRRMKRVVALKVLSPAVVDSPGSLQRFQREVEAAAKLAHPNIVQAHDADEVRGTHFLVMEYVAGKDLSHTVKLRGPLPLNAALDCLLQTARGLEYAHRQGVVHRDIKPANLLLDEQGQIKILDMGLARLTGEGEVHDLTATGTVMGTVDFMAPEQAVNSRTAGAPADIYSLGCTFYFLLTARPVYGGGSLMARMLAHRDQPIPSIKTLRPEVPVAVDELFARMVAKRPEDRFATMTEVVTATRKCLPAGSSTADLHENSTTSEEGELAAFARHRPANDEPAAGKSPQAVVPVAAPQTSIEDRPTVVTTEAAAATVVPQPQIPILPATADLAGKKSRPPWYLAVGCLAVVAVGVFFGTMTWNDGTVAEREMAVATTPGTLRVENLPVASTVPPQTTPTPTAVPQFALQFDGIDDSVEIPTLIYDGSHPLTIEGWVTLPEFQTKSPVAFFQLAERPASGEILDLRMLYAYGRAEDEASAAVIDVGTNHPARFERRRFPVTGITVRPLHVAAVIDGGQRRLFINGRSLPGEDSTLERTPSENPQEGTAAAWTFPSRIGAVDYPKGTIGWFQGVFHSLRISRFVRYREDFSPEQSLTSDAETLALYHFNQPTDGTLPDLSGHGYEGKISGATWIPLAEVKTSTPAEIDRRAAEWAISVGGAIGVNGKKRELKTREELPVDPFRLTRINLSQNPYADDAGLAHFRDCRDVTWLHLGEVAATDVGLANFRNCKQLTLLSLWKARQITDAGLANFKDLTELTFFNVADTSISDAGLVYFDGCTKLTHLHLPRSQVTDAGLIHFQNSEGFTEIELSGNAGISDAWITRFRSLDRLEKLGLEATSLTDAGLAAIAQLPSLKSLNVRGTQVTFEAVQSLQAQHPDWVIESSAIEPLSVLYPPLPAGKAGRWALHLDPRKMIELDIKNTNLTCRDDVTLEFWVQPARDSFPQSTYLAMLDPVTVLDYGTGSSAGQLEAVLISAEGNAYQTPGTPLASNKRTHLAIVSKGGRQLQFFANGRSICVFELPAGPPREDALTRVMLGHTGMDFAGAFDQLRLSRGARYETDFTPEQQLAVDEDTFALYRFDEGTGTTAADATGRNPAAGIGLAKWVQLPRD